MLLYRLPLFILNQYNLEMNLPAREGLGVECELERYDYLLRDCVGDLIGEKKWKED